MCEACGDKDHNYDSGLEAGIIVGAETGLNHLAFNDFYYPGLSQYQVEWDRFEKAISISPTGKFKQYGEAPVDKYMVELLDEMRDGLETGNKKDHISNVLRQFSDRKFEDKSWWGNLTKPEIDQLLAETKAYYIPHTAMLESGLAEAFIFGKFSKVLTESMSLKEARKKVSAKELNRFDNARIQYIQDTSKIFWDKAISRETDTVAIQLLNYNRDVTTEILKNPDRKNWRSLTSDIYHSIKRDERIVLRDLDRIVRTEIAGSQNYSILEAGRDGGYKYFFVQVRPTACKWCKGMYLDKDGNPKRFKIDDYIDLPVDLNWGKSIGDYAVQRPPLHPWCACRLYVE